MKQLDYIAGDSIFIFSDRGAWGPGDFSTGTVKRVTPSGQVIIEQRGSERRFTPAGKEVGNGGGAWRSGPWIEPKAEAEQRAAILRREHAKLRLKQEVRTDLDALGKLDATHQQADLIAGLRALADKLAQTGA